MGYPPLEDLLPKSGHSIYKLVRMASARAMELADGKPTLIESSAIEKTATIALEEIKAGKVVLKDVAHQFEPQEKPKPASKKASDEAQAEEPELSAS